MLSPSRRLLGPLRPIVLCTSILCLLFGSSGPVEASYQPMLMTESSWRPMHAQQTCMMASKPRSCWRVR
jgi:hypothetical protein